MSETTLPATVPDSSRALSDEDRNLGMLAHLLGLFTGFVGPLIIWLVYRERSTYIDFHGKEALNFQITYILATLVLGPATVILGMLTFGLLMIPFALLWMGIVVMVLVCAIIAAVAASKGDYYRYPATIRLIA